MPRLLGSVAVTGAGMTLQLLLDRRGTRQLTLLGDLHYRGIDGKAPDPSLLAAMGPPGWLRLANGDFHLDSVPAALPPALNQRLPTFLQSGLVTTGSDGRLNGDVTLSNGNLSVNGKASTPEWLVRTLSGTTP